MKMLEKFTYNVIIMQVLMTMYYSMSYWTSTEAWK